MTDYTGSPISLRNLQTGLRVDGMIVALSESEIKISATERFLPLLRTKKGTGMTWQMTKSL